MHFKIKRTFTEATGYKELWSFLTQSKAHCLVILLHIYLDIWQSLQDSMPTTVYTEESQGRVKEIAIPLIWSSWHLGSCLSAPLLGVFKQWVESEVKRGRQYFRIKLVDPNSCETVHPHSGRGPFLTGECKHLVPQGPVLGQWLCS